MSLAYIGLGSNLGDRTSQLAMAVNHLAAHRDITLVARSSIVETEPVDLLDQPRFLNQVVAVKTVMGPRELLGALKEAERRLGRVPGVPKGPRTIDLDILLYDDMVMDTDDLTIPHREIRNREFVLRHLLELDPDIVDPVTGKPFRTMLRSG
ncbi:MAG: 2-amino-4-hydroxy-6-hydroxymethyldihydropteridine diphosphokinase [Spirochaetes bacterium]|nr:2-amino-4-hydroxy-6-hydroxymethyldihydropteridine diphosphokinase [Spirochaetota bacterium]